METFILSSKAKTLQLNSTITGASNSAPILITTTVAHGLETGDIVFINGVGGNQAANGTFVVTIASSNSFTLNSSGGNGSYTAGGSAQHVGFQSAPVLVDNTIYTNPAGNCRIKLYINSLSANASVRAQVIDAVDGAFLTAQPGPTFSVVGPVTAGGFSMSQTWADARVGSPNNYLRGSLFLNGLPGTSTQISLAVND